MKKGETVPTNVINDILQELKKRGHNIKSEQYVAILLRDNGYIKTKSKPEEIQNEHLKALYGILPEAKPGDRISSEVIQKFADIYGVKYVTATAYLRKLRFKCETKKMKVII